MSVVIELVDGKGVVLVDEADAEKVMAHRWRSHPDGYAISNIRREDGTETSIRMHRLIIGADEDVVVDHINHDVRDNRRVNLRVTSQQKNLWNQRKTRTYNGKPTTSKYKGVSWSKDKGKWQARIRVDGKLRGLGRFDREEEAARAYDRAARTLFGEFAHCNFVEEMPAPASTHGVSWNTKAQKWQAVLWDQTTQHLGLFDTEDEAAAAYDAYVLSNGLDRPLNRAGGLTSCPACLL